MPHSSSSFRRAGFTLLEISIVLLIIGLLIGAVMVGQSMLRNSEVNSITSDIQRYRAAFTSFKLKYHYFPGDLPTAYQYWPNAGCTNGLALAASHTGCNGNGDDKIEGQPASPLVERYRAWQHLALSGLISGRFTGQPGPLGINDSVIGVNIPATRIPDVGIAVDPHIEYTGASAPLWAGVYDNGFLISKDSSFAGFLTPTEAYGIDLKYDDGKPGTGKIRSNILSSSACALPANSADYAIAQYDLSGSHTFALGGYYSPDITACLLRVDL